MRLKYKCSICPHTTWNLERFEKHEATPHVACTVSGCLQRRIGIAQHISKAHIEDAVERGRRISEGMRRKGYAR